MRLAAIAALLVVASPAAAERIFPSLPDSYRSGTVELHLAWGAPGSPASELDGGNDQYRIFSSNPTALRMGQVNTNGGGEGASLGGGTGSRPGNTGVGICGCH